MSDAGASGLGSPLEPGADAASAMRRRPRAGAAGRNRCRSRAGLGGAARAGGGGPWAAGRARRRTRPPVSVVRRPSPWPRDRPRSRRCSGPARAAMTCRPRPWGRTACRARRAASRTVHRGMALSGVSAVTGPERLSSARTPLLLFAVIGRRFLAGVASDAVSATGVAAAAGRRAEERRAAASPERRSRGSILSTSFNALISAAGARSHFAGRRLPLL